MLDHQCDQLVVAQFLLTQRQLAIDRFTRAKEFARPQLHFLDQSAQLLFAQRFEIIINFFESDATLPEQLVQLATLGSSWLFVNGNVVGHDLECGGESVSGGTRILRVVSRAGRPCHFFKLTHYLGVRWLDTAFRIPCSSVASHRITKRRQAGALQIYGNIPLTRVASATRSMARIYAPVRRSVP